MIKRGESPKPLMKFSLFTKKRTYLYTHCWLSFSEDLASTVLISK
jgi:hypothetical protein